jgi:aminopeptidase 2
VETVIFTFANEIPVGSTAVIRVEFTGLHNDKMAGFYRSGYTDSDVIFSFSVAFFRSTLKCFPCVGK